MNNSIVHQKDNKTVLKTVNISKSYAGLKAVNNVNLDIHEGEIFGILGPNGAGKTTTISILCGLLKADSGQVFINGEAVIKRKKGLLSQIGVCPQEILLWNRLTCLEQLEFTGRMYSLPAKLIRQRAENLLKEMKLEEKSNQLASRLSGGMKRRLNLIMALIHNPQILILDEPEAGLDPQSRVLVRDFIRKYAATDNHTVILTTHNMDEADRLVDRVAIIDAGRLLILDTPQSLKKQIGEDDVLEISLSPNDLCKLEPCLPILKKITPSITQLNGNLILRAKGIVNLLPAILEFFEKEQINIGEIKLRENTLEDVFISLTGRRLRE
jgi:ABC-2 type transport system ATP-binding protein